MTCFDDWLIASPKAKSMFNDEGKEPLDRVSVLTSPHWLGVFFLIAVPASAVPFIVGFMLGLSVSSDIVFGVYALLSGTFADLLLRWRFRKALMALLTPPIPFMVVWLMLCLYVILFQPLE